MRCYPHPRQDLLLLLLLLGLLGLIPDLRCGPQVAAAHLTSQLAFRHWSPQGVKLPGGGFAAAVRAASLTLPCTRTAGLRPGSPPSRARACGRRLVLMAMANTAALQLTVPLLLESLSRLPAEPYAEGLDASAPRELQVQRERGQRQGPGSAKMGGGQARGARAASAPHLAQHTVIVTWAPGDVALCRGLASRFGQGCTLDRAQFAWSNRTEKVIFHSETFHALGASVVVGQRHIHAGPRTARLPYLGRPCAAASLACVAALNGLCAHSLTLFSNNATHARVCWPRAQAMLRRATSSTRCRSMSSWSSWTRM